MNAPDRFAAIAASVPKSRHERPMETALHNLSRPWGKLNTQHIIDAAKTEGAGNAYLQVRSLEAAVAQLALIVNRSRAIDAQPQAGAHWIYTHLGDAEVIVEYEYDAGSPGRLSGPPEDCYEADPEEVSILGVFINGSWTDTDDLSPKLLERWEQEIIDHMESLRCEDMVDFRASEKEWA